MFSRGSLWCGGNHWRRRENQQGKGTKGMGLSRHKLRSCSQYFEYALWFVSLSCFGYNLIPQHATSRYYPHFIDPETEVLTGSNNSQIREFCGGQPGPQHRPFDCVYNSKGINNKYLGVLKLNRKLFKKNWPNCMQILFFIYKYN